MTNKLNELNEFDRRFISRDRVRKTLNDLILVKDLLKNFYKPLNKLIEEGNSLKGALKILGFFRIPGSAEALGKIQMIQEYARVVLRDLYKVNLDKIIYDYNEMYLKMDDLNQYIDELEARCKNK